MTSGIYRSRGKGTRAIEFVLHNREWFFVLLILALMFVVQAGYEIFTW